MKLCGEKLKDKKKKEILSKGYLLGYYDTIAAMMSENRVIKRRYYGRINSKINQNS